MVITRILILLDLRDPFFVSGRANVTAFAIQVSLSVFFSFLLKLSLFPFNRANLVLPDISETVFPLSFLWEEHFQLLFFSSPKDYLTKEFFWRNGAMVVVA